MGALTIGRPQNGSVIHCTWFLLMLSYHHTLYAVKLFPLFWLKRREVMSIAISNLTKWFTRWKWTDRTGFYCREQRYTDWARHGTRWGKRRQGRSGWAFCSIVINGSFESYVCFLRHTKARASFSRLRVSFIFFFQFCFSGHFSTL